MQRRSPGFDSMEACPSSSATTSPAGTKPGGRGMAERSIREMLASADILVDGNRPWDLQVHDGRFYSRLMADGTLGLGESYVEGWWDCDAVDEMCCRAIRARVEEQMPRTLTALVSLAASVALNLQTKRRARRVGEVHYDLGNDFFEAILEPSMQ